MSDAGSCESDAKIVNPETAVREDVCETAAVRFVASLLIDVEVGGVEDRILERCNTIDCLEENDRRGDGSVQ